MNVKRNATKQSARFPTLRPHHRNIYMANLRENLQISFIFILQSFCFSHNPSIPPNILDPILSLFVKQQPPREDDGGGNCNT